MFRSMLSLTCWNIPISTIYIGLVRVPDGTLRVVYLGGLGRSGSTLVERLLGELPGVCAVGEVVHLWERGVVEGERCGCGLAFADCGFWAKVGQAAFGGWDSDCAARSTAPATSRGSLPGRCPPGRTAICTSTPITTCGCTRRSAR